MKINLRFPISVNVYPINEFSYDDVCDYDIDVSMQDIIEYFYYKKYNKHYDYLGWYLEEGAKEFVKSIEDDWLHNRIDEFELANDKEFREFLKSKYEYDVERKYLDKHNLDDIRDEMIDFIEDNFDVQLEIIKYE